MGKKQFEKLCLGTVQLGLKYGIHSQRGDKPSTEESVELLRDAYDAGVRYFDTASAYGNAERLINEAGISQKNDTKIITKIGREYLDNPMGLSGTMEQCLNRLGINKADGLLLHEPEDYYDKRVIQDLIRVKTDELVEHIGISVYEPEDAVRIAQDGIVDYIQIPYNVLDQRLDYTDFFSLVKKNQIRVFARSAFLQGLLLFDLHELPGKFCGIMESLRKYQTVIQEYGFGKIEAAFLFSVCKPEIDEVVFGVDDKIQLFSNLKILERTNEFQECRKQLVGISEGINSVYVNPSRWRELK